MFRLSSGIAAPALALLALRPVRRRPPISITPTRRARELRAAGGGGRAARHRRTPGRGGAPRHRRPTLPVLPAVLSTVLRPGTSTGRTRAPTPPRAASRPTATAPTEMSRAPGGGMSGAVQHGAHLGDQRLDRHAHLRPGAQLDIVGAVLGRLGKLGAEHAGRAPPLAGRRGGRARSSPGSPRTARRACRRISAARSCRRRRGRVRRRWRPPAAAS